LNISEWLAFSLLYRSTILRTTLTTVHPNESATCRRSNNVSTFHQKGNVTMNTLCTRLLHDEAGFIVSAELVLIATIGVIAMIVGLSEVALNVNNELHDVAMAFNSVNQSFQASGMTGPGGANNGSQFSNNLDMCGSISLTSPSGEN
jgi:Flp pilus assembly pilin Flp